VTIDAPKMCASSLACPFSKASLKEVDSGADPMAESVLRNRSQHALAAYTIHDSGSGSRWPIEFLAKTSALLINEPGAAASKRLIFGCGSWTT
jgi:hypothetical protein